MNKEYEIGLKLLKSGLCLLILKDLIFYLTLQSVLFESNAIVPLSIYSRILENYNLSFLYFLFENPKNISLFLVLGIVITFIFFLNISNFFTGILLFLILIIIKLRNIYIMDGGDNLYALLIFFLAFYQPNNNKRKSRKLQRIPTDKIVLALKIQLCLVYLFAGLWKIKGGLWVEGTALYYLLNVNDFKVTKLSEIIVSSPFLYKGMTYFTVFFEMGFPFLIWFRKWRLFLIFLGVFFHIGIFILMRIDNFSLVMILIYLSFFYDNEYLFVKKYFLNKLNVLTSYLYKTS